MLSKFRFINKDFELPMLGGNEEWLTSVWVYFITGLIGAFIGFNAFGEVVFTGMALKVGISFVLTSGLFVTLVMWGGCIATAFSQIPDVKFAIRRSIFNLIVLYIVFIVCAILSVIAAIVLAIMIIGLLTPSGNRRRTKSNSDSQPTEVYDENGNVHHVSSSIGRDRIQTTDGNVMQRGADNKWRDL